MLRGIRQLDARRFRPVARTATLRDSRYVFRRWQSQIQTRFSLHAAQESFGIATEVEESEKDIRQQHVRPLSRINARGFLEDVLRRYGESELACLSDSDQ